MRFWKQSGWPVRGGRRTVYAVAGRAVESLPFSLPAGLAAFGVVAMCCLLAGFFKTWLVLSAGLLAAAVAGYCAHRLVMHGGERPGSRREQRLVDWLAVIGITLWLGANIPFAAQHIFTDRDPATYAVAGAWLTSHDDLRIPEPDGFGDVPGVSTDSLGFSASTLRDGEIYAQGSHILPAFLGIAGRLAGQEAMLHFNVIFGAAALLAVYGFGRLITKPRWALAATATLSVSLPIIYFARDTYTEPMALAFVFSCLTALWYAVRTTRYAAWLLAGLLLGAGLLVRIDIYLAAAAIGLFLIFELCVAKKGTRRPLLRRQAAFVGAAGLVGLLAWLDLTLLSSGYYRDLRPHFIAEIYLIVAVAVTGLLLTGLAWKTQLLHRIEEATRRRRAAVGAVLIAGFFVLLASRPAWLTAIATKDGTIVRSYAEYTLVWLTWYIGPVLVILALAAIVQYWRHILDGRALRLLPVMLVVGASLMYLVNPNISSDQVWAARRFVPVVLPGFAVLGFMLIGRLYDRPALTVRGHSLHPQVLATMLATLAVIGPLFVSFPFLVTRTYAPQLAQIEYVCSQAPDDAVVVWAGKTKDFAMQPTQAFCGLPSVGIEPGADAAKVLPEVAAAAERQGRRVVIGVKEADLAAIPEQYRPSLTSRHRIAYADLEQTYKKFPRNRILLEQTILLGEVSADGSITPIRR